MADEAIVKVVRRYLQALVRHGILFALVYCLALRRVVIPTPGATLICWWCHPGLTTNAGGMT